MLYHWAIRALLVGKPLLPGIWFTTAPTGNRTQGKCLEGTYVTTTPLAPDENLRDSFTCLNTKPPPPKAGNIPLDQTDATISHHATSINTALKFTAPSWESTLMHVHSGVIEEIWVDMEVEGSATGAHQNIPGPTLFVCWWPGDKHQAGMLILTLCTQVIRIVTSLALTKVAFAMLKLGGGVPPPTFGRDDKPKPKEAILCHVLRCSMVYFVNSMCRTTFPLSLLPIWYLII